MDQHQNPSPEDQALLKAAQDDEQAALSGYLQGRVVTLNVEVRRRDQEIARLNAVVASLESQVAEFGQAEPTQPDDTAPES